jgi:hypothetical protein
MTAAACFPTHNQWTEPSPKRENPHQEKEKTYQETDDGRKESPGRMTEPETGNDCHTTKNSYA